MNADDASGPVGPRNEPDTGIQAGDAASDLDSKGSPSLFSKPWVRIAAAGVILVLLIGGIVYWRNYRSYGRFQESTNNAYLASDDVAIAPKISGYVTKVLVAENQRVRAGQPLVVIDARQSQADVQRAQAQVTSAYANARNMEAQGSQQQAQIAQAHAELSAARKTLESTRREVDRYAPLAETGASPRERLSQLVLQRDQASADVRARIAALDAQQRRVAQLRAMVEQALAQADASAADLRSVSVDLGSTVLRAPVDGIVGNRNVRVGQYVQAGMELMTVVPVQALYIKANFKETQITLMRPGQPASIKVDALPGAEIAGVVESVAPGTGARFSLIPPENATGNFTKIVQRVAVRIRVEAGGEARQVLVPGLSAEVSVDTRGGQGFEQRIEDETARQQRTIEAQHDKVDRQAKPQP